VAQIKRGSILCLQCASDIKGFKSISQKSIILSRFSRKDREVQTDQKEYSVEKVPFESDIKGFKSISQKSIILSRFS